MAFTGRVNNLETRSQRSSTAAPERRVPGTSTRWSPLRNSIRATWGIARPIKPIGPQKAVTVPASSVVERNSSPRERRIFSPIVTAYSSPNSRRLSGLIVITASSKPAITDGTRTASCGTVTSPSDPIVQTTKAFKASSLLRYCRICTTAPTPDENIMPRIRMTMMSLMRWPTAAITSSTVAAPAHAAVAMPTDEPTPASTTSATPRLAPELMPST